MTSAALSRSNKGWMQTLTYAYALHQPRGQSKPEQLLGVLGYRSGTGASSRISVKMALPPIVSATAQSAVLSATSNILAQAITAYRSDV